MIYEDDINPYERWLLDTPKIQNFAKVSIDSSLLSIKKIEAG